SSQNRPARVNFCWLLFDGNRVLKMDDSELPTIGFQEHSMRRLTLLVLLSLTYVALGFSQEKPLHGINPNDIDRAADPCQDFFQFANGKWRAENPIPPSMVRWSRRWSAGESTKNVLHDILDDASKNSSKTE